MKRAFQQADAIVAVGCRFSSWLWDEHGPLARRRHALVKVNIDPSALGSPALHAVAMQAGARLALDDLLAALPADLPAIDPDWLGALRGVRAAYDAQLAEMAGETAAVMHPAALAHAVGQRSPPTRWRSTTAATPLSGATT